MWNSKHSETSGFTPESELVDIIAKNRGINPEELRDKLNNPTDYEDNLDKIERIK